jgi:hypothetical protein
VETELDLQPVAQAAPSVAPKPASVDADLELLLS